MVKRKATEKNGGDLNNSQTTEMQTTEINADKSQPAFDKKVDIEEEFNKLYQKALQLGLSEEDFAKMEVLRDIRWRGSYGRMFLRGFGIFLIIVAVLFYSAILVYILDWPIGKERMLHFWFGMYGSDPELEPCLVDMPESVTEIFRPPVECSFCENLTQVQTVYNISQEEFEELYAYTGVPVVIGDGTVNWTAPQFFSFEFFKDIYKIGSPILDNHERNCQFFPYKTSFRRLADVMEMSPERARLADGSEPWYIGWSNCDFSAANTLRKHYKRPYFLPKLSESSKTDWVFMGSPGYGAHMHIDNVGNPSWQAQITGTKRWTLEPPPECYYTCADRITVTVQPGQIIVLDTNIWFHSTLNVGDDISITIGSEFD